MNIQQIISLSVLLYLFLRFTLSVTLFLAYLFLCFRLSGPLFISFHLAD
jgi:hypothetical protein